MMNRPCRFMRASTIHRKRWCSRRRPSKRTAGARHHEPVAVLLTSLKPIRDRLPCITSSERACAPSQTPAIARPRTGRRHGICMIGHGHGIWKRHRSATRSVA
jgi:hypothetical protein